MDGAALFLSRLFLPPTMGGAKPVIWIIDSEHWPRAYLRAELMERGYEAISFAALSQVLTEINRLSPRPNAIILDLRGQEITREGLDAMARSNIPVIGIGGILELNNALVSEFKWADFLRRPVTIGAVADAVERQKARNKECGGLTGEE